MIMQIQLIKPMVLVTNSYIGPTIAKAVNSNGLRLRHWRIIVKKVDK